METGNSQDSELQVYNKVFLKTNFHFLIPSFLALNVILAFRNESWSIQCKEFPLPSHLLLAITRQIIKVSSLKEFLVPSTLGKTVSTWSPEFPWCQGHWGKGALLNQPNSWRESHLLSHPYCWLFYYHAIDLYSFQQEEQRLLLQASSNAGK